MNALSLLLQELCMMNQGPSLSHTNIDSFMANKIRLLSLPVHPNSVSFSLPVSVTSFMMRTYLVLTIFVLMIEKSFQVDINIK